MKCAKCGKEIKRGAAFCPYCGTPQAGDNAVQNKGNGTKRSYNNICVIGLVAAVLVSFFNFGELGGLLAVGLSIYGLMQCRKTGERGKVLAVIGIVIGIFAMMNASVQREFDSLMYWFL